MRRILNKQQVQVVMVLNAVLIILFCGVVFLMQTDGPTADAGTGTDGKVPPHPIIRAARLSANENIAWEINFGGTGDERLLAVYRAYNRIYVFGNTASGDLDFAGNSGGGFAATLTDSGNTQTFTVFPFSIVKAVPAGRGFALAGNGGDGALLALLDSDCAVLATAQADALHKPAAVDLKIYDESYFLVCDNYVDSVTKNNLLVTVYDGKLTKTCTRVFTQTFELKYVDLLPHGNLFLLAADVVTSVKAHYLTFAVFGLKAEPAFVDVDKVGFSYETSTVTPYAGGYAALVNRDGRPEFLTVDANLSDPRSKHLSFDSAQNASLCFTGGNFYGFFGFGADAALIRFDTSLSGDTRLEKGNDLTALFDAASNEKATYLLGGRADELALLGYASDGAEKDLRFASAAETNALVLPVGDGVLIAAQSTEKSADVGGNFGGSDIWLCKLLF